MKSKIVVQIPGARQTYTYSCEGPVEVGDKVSVPGPPWAPETEQRGEVVGFGTDGYDGHLVEAKVIRNADR